MDKDMRPESISYYDHESQIARSETHIKRLFVIWAVTFAALIITNAAWLYHESMYQDVVTVEQEADTTEAPVYLNGTGEMTINGKGEAESN